MAKEFGLQATSFAAATVGALLVAKVVVVADMLPAINRFPDKPLVFTAANEKLWSELVWAHFWAIQLWLVVLVFI